MSPTTETELMQRSYAAFISYRHADNVEAGRQWASWLHQSIETYEVPEDLVGTKNTLGETIPARIFPVFRDEEELPADADLSAAIVRALEASRCLLVLCSPGAVASRFVAEEITQFKRIGKGERIIAAILSGEPNVTSKVGQEAKRDISTECFPEPLRFELGEDGSLSDIPSEPLAADFRLRDGTEGWTNPEAYRLSLESRGITPADVARSVEAYAKRLEIMKLKLIAGILGVPLGMLTQRDKAYRLLKERRRSRNLRRWLAAVVVLAVLAFLGGGLALLKQREAQQRQAEVVAALAASDFQQGTQALESADTTPEAMALLARAVRDGGHEGALTRLWTLLQQRRFWLPAVGGQLQAAPEKRNVEIPAQIRERFARVEIKGQHLEPKALEISADGTRVVTTAGHAALDGITGVRVWKSDGTPLTPWFEPDYSGGFYVQTLDARLSADGRFVAVIASPNREPQYVELREVDSLKRWGDHVEATGKGPHYQNVPLTIVEFLPESNPESAYSVRLLVASGRGDASVYSISDLWTAEVAQNRHRTPVLVASTDPGQEWLMSASADGEVLVSSLLTGDPVGNPVALEAAPTAVTRNASAQLAIVPDGGEALFFNLLPETIVALSDDLGEPRLRSLCVDWRVQEDHPHDDVMLVHPVSGYQILYRGKRAFGIKAPQAGAGDPSERKFSDDLALVCLDRERGFIFSTTAAFVTEVWALDKPARVGKPIVEQRLFAPGETPDEARSITLSPDGHSLLIHSFLWDPPNLAHHWFSLWDLTSGKLLADRMHLGIDGSEQDPIELAEFDESGNFLLFLSRQGKDRFKVVSWLQIRPPTGVDDWLPELVEAIGGLAYDRMVNLEAVTDRLADLRRLLQKLKQKTAGYDPQRF